MKISKSSTKSWVGLLKGKERVHQKYKRRKLKWKGWEEIREIAMRKHQDLVN